MGATMLSFDQPSRAMEVARYIESLIEERSLEPGEKIATKEELRIQSGVARATINEAVKLLFDRGRVLMKPGPSGGIFVAKSDPGVQLGRFLLAVGNDAASVADAIALRDFLETMVIEEAVRYRNKHDVAELRDCLDAMRLERDQTEGLLGAIWALHDRIVQITPNIMLRTTYQGLAQFIRDQVSGLQRSSDSATVDYNDERIRIHEALIDVIDSGDMTRVGPVMKLHNQAP